MRILTGFLLSLLIVSRLPAGDADLPQLLDAGRFKQARAVLEPRVKANPGDAAAAAMLARVRIAFGDLDGAVQLAETAIKLDGKVADYHWQLARAVGEQARRATMLKAFGLSKRFRAAGETALGLDPKLVEPRMYLISFYAGASSMAGGDRKRAEALAAEVGGIDRASGFLAQARILEEDASSTEGPGAAQREALYKQAIAAAKTSAVGFQARLSLFNLYFVQQKLDLAEQMGRELLAMPMEPRRIQPYSALVSVHAARARWTDVEGLFAEAAWTVPENPLPYYQAGRVIVSRGNDFARAERYLRQFLTKEPEAGLTPAHGHWQLGLALEKQGKRTEAVAALEEAIRLNPDFEAAKKDLKRVRGSSL